MDGDSSSALASDYSGLRNWVTRLDSRVTRLEERSIHNAEDAIRMEGLVDRSLKDIRMALAEQSKSNAEQIHGMSTRLDRISDINIEQIERITSRLDKLTLSVAGAIIAFLGTTVVELVRFYLEKGGPTP